MANYVRVSTIAWSAGAAGLDNLEDTHSKLARLLEAAAAAQPDIVVLTEFCNVHGGSDFPEQAQPVPGPTTDLCAEIADAHDMYVVCPLPERHADVMYNTAAFVGRNGEIVGKYHKFQPTIGEMEKGIRPGTEAPVFDLDFGKVGAAVCFDLKFVEVGQQLAAGDCRLCAFPSMFVGGDRLQHWTRDFGMYLVSSVPSHSYIIDMAGAVLAETGSKIDQVQRGLVPPIASAVINMDRCLFHLDHNQDRLPDIIDTYGNAIEYEIHSPEAYFTLASTADDLTVDDIIAEFDLEPWTDYLARARRARQAALEEAD